MVGDWCECIKFLRKAICRSIEREKGRGRILLQASHFYEREFIRRGQLNIEFSIQFAKDQVSLGCIEQSSVVNRSKESRRTKRIE